MTTLNLTTATKPASKLSLVVDNPGFVKPFHSSTLRLRKKLVVHTNESWRNPEQKAADQFVAFLLGRFTEEMTRNFGESEANIHISKLPSASVIKLAQEILRSQKFSATVVQLKSIGENEKSGRVTMRRTRS